MRKEETYILYSNRGRDRDPFFIELIFFSLLTKRRCSPASWYQHAYMLLSKYFVGEGRASPKRRMKNDLQPAALPESSRGTWDEAEKSGFCPTNDNKPRVDEAVRDANSMMMSICSCDRDVYSSLLEHYVEGCQTRESGKSGGFGVLDQPPSYSVESSNNNPLVSFVRGQFRKTKKMVPETPTRLSPNYPATRASARLSPLVTRNACPKVHCPLF